MSTVVLCRNFSGGTLAFRSVRTREIRTEPTAAAEGEGSEQVKTDGLSKAA
jgi:hypothetical protein